MAYTDVSLPCQRTYTRATQDVMILQRRSLLPRMSSNPVYNPLDEREELMRIRYVGLSPFITGYLTLWNTGSGYLLASVTISRLLIRCSV